MELNEKVKNEAFEASAEKIKAEQSLSEKRKWITDTFELGKQFYQQGKFDKAMDEWTKLSPYLEASSGVQKLIDAVKENYAASLEAKKSAVQAAASDYTGLKLPYAQSMTKLLTEADEKLKQDTESYREKQENMKRTMAEREEWSVTTFNKGKVYYDQGDYDQALGQWERLVPYLDQSSDIKTKIESLRENYNTLLAGKEALGDPTKERPVKLEKADTMLAVLEEANQKLKNDSQVFLSKSDEVNRSIRQRKEWIEYSFNKGKTYYDQGDFAKAVEEWSILQPYLGEHPEIRDQIEELKTGFKEGKLAEKVIKEMDEKKRSLIPLPEQIEVPSNEVGMPSVMRALPSQADPAESSQEPLQLVSGEIVSIDEPQKTLTLKHFSESGVEETLTVNFDGATKLDGQAVQSLSTIQSGTEIDLRYNPQTSHALYIYVY
jgi:tetratricopeptide (TPR) repeat protein